MPVSMKFEVVADAPARPEAAPPPDVASDAPPPSLPRLSRPQLATITVTPIVLLCLAWVLPLVLYANSSAPERKAESHPEPDGAKLYAQHCARCHGEAGNGQGLASLDPSARNFGEAKFRLATTANAFPDDADLNRIVRAGIPGSAMPGYPELSDDELASVLQHVRRLTRGGFYNQLRHKASQQGEVDAEELSIAAGLRTRPGDPLAIPAPFPAESDAAIARGRQHYLTTCASCHGPEGRGDGPQVKDLKNDDGSPTRPRDLTLGRFKGGGEPKYLYARITLGMPGTPMPASTTLKPNDVVDLVHYVRSIAPTPTSSPASH